MTWNLKPETWNGEAPDSPYFDAMPQMQWTYPADSGQLYRVNLYHGGRTGHVLVTVNLKVTIVDFGVRQSKEYELMLEDELFTLELVKDAKGWSYAFVIDKQADTDRNRARKRMGRRQAVWIAVGAVAFFSIALLLGLALRQWQEGIVLHKNLPLLDEMGEHHTGRLSPHHDGHWTAHVIVEGEVFHVQAGLAPDSLPAPVAGDDIGVLFLPGNPKVHRVDWLVAGPIRSARLLEDWSADSRAVSGLDAACVARVVRPHADLLTDPAAPWQSVRPRDLAAWLSVRDPTVWEAAVLACSPEE